jgi:hypothetical protein
MPFKIINITQDDRQFRVHRIAKGYFLRPGEEVIVPFAPIVVNEKSFYNTFKVTNLDSPEENKIVEVTSKKKSSIKPLGGRK